MTVTPENDGPAALPGSAFVAEDGSVAIGLSAIDLETPDAGLTFVIASLPTRGSLLDSSGNLVAIGQTFTGAPTLTYVSGAAWDGAGADSFTFTVVDTGDGTSPALTSAPATVSIDITQAAAAGEVTIDADGVVRIGGTSGSDVIRVSRTSDGNHLRVTINGVTVTSSLPAIALSSISEIRAWGRDGNDQIEIVDLPQNTFLHGGADNDTIVGGSGRDIIFGGLGDDHITGSAGNDFLIGGSGSDRIVGSAGHDILVAGEVACAFTLADLDEVITGWAANRTADEEMPETDGDMLDEAFDMLTGGSGSDWFILGTNDKITDFKVVSKDGDLVSYV